MTKKKEPLPKLPPRWVRNAELARYLNISGMCLYRWQRDDGLGFPQPAVINDTSYTDLNAIDLWMRSRIGAPLPKGRKKKDLTEQVA